MILNKLLYKVREQLLELLTTDACSPLLSSRATLRLDVRATALEQQRLSGRAGGGGNRSPVDARNGPNATAEARAALADCRRTRAPLVISRRSSPTPRVRSYYYSQKS